VAGDKVGVRSKGSVLDGCDVTVAMGETVVEDDCKFVSVVGGVIVVDGPVRTECVDAVVVVRAGCLRSP
jgi:hypothetical protein